MHQLSGARRLRYAGAPGGAAPAPAASHFSQRAQAMNARIAGLAGEIQQLTRVAKHSSVFEDQSERINELTVHVKGGLQSLVRARARRAPSRVLLT